MKKYTETHEWVLVDGETATVGITNHAQEELGDIVYVELPEINSTAKAYEEVAVLESTKAAADIYTPLSGTIIAINENLKAQSELINQSPEESGWIFKIKLHDSNELNELMDENEYNKMIS